MRQARGLNQSEVGFGRYSASYVSLLERGLRKPNPEVVRFLSDHLGVEPAQFMDFDSGQPTHLEHEFTVLDVASRNAWLDRDYEQAVVLARQAARAADVTGRPDSWWSSTHLLAQALRALEQYEECHELAVELSTHSCGDAVTRAGRRGADSGDARGPR